METNDEEFVPIIGCKYQYKRDGRLVSVIQLDRKVGRVEVIIGLWNPFWVNFSELE